MYYVDAILNAQESDFECVGMVGTFFSYMMPLVRYRDKI